MRADFTFSITLCPCSNSMETILKNWIRFRTKKKSTEKIKEFVEFRHQIMESFSYVVQCFNGVMSWTFWRIYFLSAKRCFILQILIWMEYSCLSRLWCSLSMPYLTIYDNKSKSRERKEIKKFNKFDFQSEELASFVYSSCWYEFETDACKKSIAFMIMKFQYPLKIKIFRIVKVHLKLFVVLG